MSRGGQVADVDILASVPIAFEGADGATTHAPLVVGRVGGLETRLVLDTGSDVHLLTKELVDRLGLAVEEGEEGMDHSGATMPSWAVEDVGLELDPLELTLRDVVAIPAPKPFPARGIGGILSPHNLHPSAWAVVDLVAHELVLLEGDSPGIAAWLEERAHGRPTLTLERDEAFPTIVVPAAIRPHPELPTLLNTGGRHTEFSSKAVPGIEGATTERLGGGVSGADVLGAKAGSATLVVAGHDVPVASLAVRAVMHGPEGHVGMDVLRGTTLAVCADLSRPVLWQIPSGDGDGGGADQGSAAVDLG